MVASGRSDPPEARSQASDSPPEAESTFQPSPAEGLYIHVPFCVSLCPYCDFVVVAGSAARGPGNRIDALLEALLQELKMRAGQLRAERLRAEPGEDARPALGSVYLGGGTPSLLRPAQVGRLLAGIREMLGIVADAEVTLEANPGADEIGDLAGFREAGVTRLSIGAQSLVDVELRRLGRRHRPEDVVAAVKSARRAGFESLNLDLLTDIPGQSLVSWRRTLDLALGLGPDHLSVYALMLDDPGAEGLTGVDGDHLPLSRGARQWRSRARAEQSEDRAAEMELLTDELATAAGLRRYEIANLARPGHESRHNLLYWRRRPCLALGPGAHAFDGARTRRWNAARLDGYLGALSRGELPPGGSDVVDEAMAVAETAILGLRLTEGIGAGLATQPRIAPALAWARAHGLVEDVAARTRLTQLGRLLADEVFRRLVAAPSGRRGSRVTAPHAASA